MRYRYIIVEDEATARRGIELKMQLIRLPFDLVGTASNGVEGLKLIRREKPHLVIADIRMPDMDGIELLEIIRQEALDVEIIIASGYSNFEYARAGIHADICEYLLKPFSEDELREAVLLVMERMRRKGIPVSMPKPQAGFEEDLKLLSDRLMGVRAHTGPTAFSRLNIDPERGRFVVCEAVRIGEVKALKKPEGLDELVCIEAPGLPDRSFIVCYSRSGVGETALKQVLEQLPRAHSIGVSLPCPDLDRLHVARHQAQTARRDRPMNQTGTCRFFSEPAEIQPMSNTKRDRMLLALESADAEWFRVQFIECCESCVKQGFSVNDLLRLLRRFFEDAISYFSALSEGELPTLFQFDYLTARCADDDQLPEAILRFMLSSFHADTVGSVTQTIGQIRQYLDSHFEEDLSLERIGQLFNVSPGYISRLFSHHFGMSYSGYISALRIDHSCRLLSGSDKEISAIAAHCGFNNVKYFYKVFKKQLGCTPSEYRRHHSGSNKKDQQTPKDSSMR